MERDLNQAHKPGVDIELRTMGARKNREYGAHGSPSQVQCTYAHVGSLVHFLNFWWTLCT